MRLMLEVDMEATELGKLVLSEGASERLQAFGKTIRDTFAAKATATIYKRTRCYWIFFTWCRAVQAGNGLRLSEKVVYKYLSYLQEEGAGATSGDAFLQSLRFFHASWQFVGLNLDQELSARVKGVAHVLYCKKPLLKQARALSVAELAALMGGANPLGQAYEYWRCGDFVMAESHGTREFKGGGELVPHPETAAQIYGWRSRLSAGNAGVWQWLNHTERVSS